MRVLAPVLRAPRGTRRLLAVALALLGALLAWKAYLATGTGCFEEHHLDAPSASGCYAWEAWWRWPVAGVSALLLAGAIGLGVQTARDPRPKGRRGR